MANGFTRRIRGLGEGSSSTQNRPNIQNDNYSYYKVDKEKESYKHKGGAWDPNRSFSNQYNEKRRNNEIGLSSIEKEYNNLNQEINDFRQEHESYKNGDIKHKEYTPYGKYGDQNYQSYEQEALNRYNKKDKKKEFFNSLGNNKKIKNKNKNTGYSNNLDFSKIKFDYPWMIKMIAVILFVIFIISAYVALNSNNVGEEYDFQRQYEELIRR